MIFLNGNNGHLHDKRFRSCEHLNLFFVNTMERKFDQIESIFTQFNVKIWWFWSFMFKKKLNWSKWKSKFLQISIKNFHCKKNFIIRRWNKNFHYVSRSSNIFRSILCMNLKNSANLQNRNITVNKILCYHIDPCIYIRRKIKHSSNFLMLNFEIILPFFCLKLNFRRLWDQKLWILNWSYFFFLQFYGLKLFPKRKNNFTNYT